MISLYYWLFGFILCVNMSFVNKSITIHMTFNNQSNNVGLRVYVMNWWFYTVDIQYKQYKQYKHRFSGVVEERHVGSASASSLQHDAV